MVLRLIPDDEILTDEQIDQLTEDEIDHLLTEDEIEMLRESFEIDAYVKAHPMPEHHGLWRIAADERKAAASVEPLLRQTPREKWLELTTHPALRTAGVLGYLHGLGEDARTGDPEYALAVAELAVAVAEAMPEEIYAAIPHLLDYQLVQTWTNVGRSFRALGRYDEAIGALQTAGSIRGEQGLFAYFVAVSDFILAEILQETNRFDEARPLFEKCEKILSRYGAADVVAQCADALQRGPIFRLRGLPSLQKD